jgi:hypothetical protein
VSNIEGYIKLYRQITEHWLWQRKPFSPGQAWLDIILMANHEENKFPLGNEIIEIERGEWVTSEIKLMNRWGWSKAKVRAFLNLLQNDSMIDKKTDSKKTILKVLNYSVWQDIQTTKEPEKNQRKTGKKPEKDTNKNDKNDKNINNTYISAQHLSMTKTEYDKLVSLYGQSAVDSKIEYARNYKRLKNYVSLYLTLNNWLKADQPKPSEPKQSKSEQKQSAIDLALEEATRRNREAGIIED